MRDKNSSQQKVPRRQWTLEAARATINNQNILSVLRTSGEVLCTVPFLAALDLTANEVDSKTGTEARAVQPNRMCCAWPASSSVPLTHHYLRKLMMGIDIISCADILLRKCHRGSCLIDGLEDGNVLATHKRHFPHSPPPGKKNPASGCPEASRRTLDYTKYSHLV